MTSSTLFRMTLLFAVWGCTPNAAQQNIDKWNADFTVQKRACEMGDAAACRTACEMSRKATVCAEVAKTADMKDPEQRAWVEACPAKALSDGASSCAAADVADKAAPPAEAPLRTATPVAAGPVAQNVARFDRINSRGRLPEVGAPIYAVPDTPGPVYFTTRGSGLVRLDENGFSTAVSTPDNILQIRPGPKGALWLLGHNGVFRFDGNRVESYEGEGQSRGFNALAVAPNGDLWVTGLYGVSRLRGKTWSLYSKKSLTGEDHTTLYTIAADSLGRIWLTAHQAIYVFENDSWRALHINQKQDASTIYLGVAAIARNKLYVAATGGLLQIDQEEWMQWSPGTGVFSINHIDARQDRLFLAGTRDIRVLSLEGNEPVRKLIGGGKDFPASQIRGFAADGQGRIWLADDAGPMVIEPSGKTTLWPFGSVDALRHRVTDIYAVGNGPPTLPPVATVRTSPITGRMVSSGTPARKVDIALCPSASMFAKGTPCDGQPFEKRAVTDAGGRFRIDDVPVGAVQIVFRPAGAAKWTIPMGSCCGKRAPDKPYDLGDLDLDKGAAIFLFGKR